MSTATIVIVPGLWMGSTMYELLVDNIKKKAPSIKEIIVANLRSTGKSSPGGPKMHDDVEGIRECLRQLVEAGKRVILVCHSAGACIAAMATEDLEVGAKLSKGKGGVESLIVISGGLLSKGAPAPDMMIDLNIQDGKAFVANREEVLFHDVEPVIADKYLPILSYQPAEGWNDGVCNYAGWEKLPCYYIICEKDRVMPSQYQQLMAETIKAKAITIPTGHMPQLAKPELLAEKIVSCFG